MLYLINKSIWNKLFDLCSIDVCKTNDDHIIKINGDEEFIFICTGYCEYVEQTPAPTTDYLFPEIEEWVILHNVHHGHVIVVL